MNVRIFVIVPLVPVTIHQAVNNPRIGFGKVFVNLIDFLIHFDVNGVRNMTCVKVYLQIRNAPLRRSDLNQFSSSGIHSENLWSRLEFRFILFCFIIPVLILGF